jgi:hypothetical protein
MHGNQYTTSAAGVRQMPTATRRLYLTGYEPNSLAVTGAGELGCEGKTGHTALPRQLQKELVDNEAREGGTSLLTGQWEIRQPSGWAQLKRARPQGRLQNAGARCGDTERRPWA